MRGSHAWHLAAQSAQRTAVICTEGSVKPSISKRLIGNPIALFFATTSRAWTHSQAQSLGQSQISSYDVRSRDANLENDSFPRARSSLLAVGHLCSRR
jgi:hypothetical protein